MGSVGEDDGSNSSPTGHQGQAVQVRVAGEETRFGKEGGVQGSSEDAKVDKPLTALDQLRLAQKQSP